MSGKDGGVIVDSPAPVKPKSLLEAVGEIQKMFVTEKHGADADEALFTTLNTVDFLEVGMKGAFASGILSAIFTPMAFCVIERMIPVFGSTQPSLFDQLYVFAMALFFSIGYAMFVGSVGKYYIGPITKQMIRYLVGGVATGAIFKLVIVFIFYHWLAFKVLTASNVESFLLKFSTKYNDAQLVWAYRWLMEFKPILITSAWFMVLTTAIFIAIPVASVIRGAIKYRHEHDIDDF